MVLLPRMRRWIAPYRAVATLLATFFLASTWPAAAAVFPPHLRFRSLVGARITVHYHDGLEPTARRAASLAASLLETHERRYGVRLPRIHIVVADVTDDPNGFSSPQPYPLIQIRAAAPDGTDDFGNLESWLRLVLTHELAHSVHLEQARGVPALGRKIFGRNPYFFPNIFAITWMIEGLATYEETQTTAFGRGRNPDSRMVLRVAALEGKFPREDQAVDGLDVWPGGHASYLFGESFLRQTSLALGEDTLPKLARSHSDNLVPWLDEWTFKQVTKKSAAGRWRDWVAQSTEIFRLEAAERASAGLTPSRPLTARGIRQVAPRFSPDGQWVAYTSFSLERHTGLRLVRTDGSGDRELVRRNGGSRSVVDARRQEHRLRRVRVRGTLRRPLGPARGGRGDSPGAQAHQEAAGPRSRRFARRSRPSSSSSVWWTGASSGSWTPMAQTRGHSRRRRRRRSTPTPASAPPATASPPHGSCRVASWTSSSSIRRRAPSRRSPTTAHETSSRRGCPTVWPSSFAPTVMASPTSTASLLPPERSSA